VVARAAVLAYSFSELILLEKSRHAFCINAKITVTINTNRQTAVKAEPRPTVAELMSSQNIQALPIAAEKPAACHTHPPPSTEGIRERGERR